jgi:ribosomal protein S24E
MNIIKEDKNKLLKRNEITAVFEADSNPGLEKLQKDLSTHFKSESENIIVNKLVNNFGTNSFMVNALIYDSKEDKEKIEPKKKEKKGAKK